MDAILQAKHRENGSIDIVNKIKIQSLPIWRLKSKGEYKYSTINISGDWLVMNIVLRVNNW